MLRKVPLICALFAVSAYCLPAQVTPSAPCQPEYIGLSFRIPRPIIDPPVDGSTPLNVALAYVVNDSIIYNVDRSTIDSVIEEMPYNDTLRQAMKYFYEMVDNDPITYQMYQHTEKIRSVPKIFPDNVPLAMSCIVNRASPEDVKFANRALIDAEIIAHIRVDDTYTQTDTSASWARSGQVVSATIVDPIKGKVIPACYPFQGQPEHQQISSMAAEVGACLQFEYRLEHALDATVEYFGGEMRDANGNPWVKSGKEYIAFLRLEMLCGDENDVYLYTAPVGLGTQGSLYPVENGIVQDVHNDFGFGSNLTAPQFIAALRNHINYITNP